MEGQNRVKAMSLIHQKLYQNENLASINFADYAKELAEELATIYKSPAKIVTQIEAQDGTTDFDIDTAVPLGLIRNELISNAYKYAFEASLEGINGINLKRKEDRSYKPTVADNGHGLPIDFEFHKAKSVGVRLVRRLAKQLYGEVEYQFTDDANFVITFKNTLQKRAV